MKDFAPPKEYPGDKTMKELLSKAGAERGLFGVYGLFHGLIASPKLVMPSVYMPVIFGEEGGQYESAEEAKILMSGLMGLWDFLAKWDAAAELSFPYPEANYPGTAAGLAQRIANILELIDNFNEGLALGGMKDKDLSPEANKAIASLSRMHSHLEQYREAVEAGEETGEETPRVLDKVEDAVADMIAQVNIGLTQARKRAASVMQPLASFENIPPAVSTKVGRNEPCPCGSGRKYKKCCGLTH